MQGTAEQMDMEARLATLERRFEQLVGPLRPSASRVDPAARMQAQPPSGSYRPVAPEPARSMPTRRPFRAGPATRTAPALPVPHAGFATPPAPASFRDRAARNQSLIDLVGGRLLAWLGGVTTVIGVVLLLALAISHGWVGREARVAIAALLSCVLMAAGTWLHAHRGRTEAAGAMVGAATAALYATLIVASHVYGLIPAMLAVALSLLVGGVATTLAIRWAGRALAALGFVGGLLSPVLVGASPSFATTALLALACACAMAVVVRRGWSWLGLASLLVCAPQWASWLLAGQSPVADVAVLAAFGAIGLAGAVGGQMHGEPLRRPRGPMAIAALSACLVAAVGHFALEQSSGAAAGELWLAALAGAHLLLGVCRIPRVAIARPLRAVLIALGVALADVAFGLGAGGVALVIGWAGTAAAFAWLARPTAPGSPEESLMGLGLGAHLGLTLIRALIDAPPSTLGASAPDTLALLSVATLAAACLGSAQAVGGERASWRTALNLMGLGATAYLTASALSGPALACAWCVEAVVLARFATRSPDPVARWGGLGFLALAVLHVVEFDAPPSALITGVSDPAGAAAALGGVALAAFGAARAFRGEPRWRIGLLTAAAGALVYLASVAVVTVFQPGARAGGETVLELTVQQEGQVLLSTFWAAAGVTALIVGLRRERATVRSIALGWLMVTAGKVFLYDLSTLTSIFRVVSFVALGLLLLGGAYAYQRLRPPAPPDMRSLHPSQR
jgi:uncharacterized membrane protein